MFKEITVGGKPIPFLSNGVTPLLYKQLFKNDLLKALNSNGEFEIANEKIPELAFIMAKQGEKGVKTADLMKLNFESYVEWLSQFEPLDLVMVGADIVNVYISDSIQTEEPKKKEPDEAKE